VEREVERCREGGGEGEIEVEREVERCREGGRDGEGGREVLGERWRGR